MTDKIKDQEGEVVDSQQFHTSASDMKGHSLRMYYRCQPGIAAQVQMILASGKFPYTSHGDVVRHALMRLFHWLNTIAPVRGVLAQIEIINKILAQEEFADMFSGVFERISTRVSVYINANEKGEAVRLVRTVQDQIKEMDDGYWRDKYTREVKERWGHLLQQAETVNLLDSEEE